MEVKIKRVVEVIASADDWGLYDIADREATAQYLNEYFERCVESGLTSGGTFAAMERVMLTSYAVYGAADTEGYNTLDKLLDMAYGA